MQGRGGVGELKRMESISLDNNELSYTLQVIVITLGIKFHNPLKSSLVNFAMPFYRLYYYQK